MKKFVIKVAGLNWLIASLITTLFYLAAFNIYVSRNERIC